MNLNTLILELGDCTLSIMPKTDLKKDFAQVQYFSPDRGAVSGQVLYFCRWTELLHVRIPDRFTAVIWDDRTDRTSDDLAFLDAFAGGLLVPTRADFDACYTCFENSFLLAYNADRQLEAISEVVYAYGDLQDLTNRIAGMFDHPANIVDNSFRLIASSDNYAFFSEDLARDNRTGFITPEVLKRLNLSSARRRNLQQKTLVIDHISGQFQNYLTPILFNSIALGYFSVFLPAGEEMSPILKQYLQRVAVLLGVYMQRTDLARSSPSSYYTTLLSGLLSENPLLNSMKEERFQLYGYHMKKFKYICLVDIAREDPEEFDLADLGDAFQKIFDNSIYLTQHNQIIYLASGDSQIEDPDLLRERCANQLLSTPGVRVGISAAFTLLAEARGHYSEARAAIETGIMLRSRDQLFFYDDCRLMYMIQNLGKFTDIRMFMLPQIRLLQDHDRDRGSELLYTLYIYVNRNGNVPGVCEVLHIHRNTLYFRLNRIAEITRLDLDSAETRAMILVSFGIMRMQNEIDW